MGTEHVIPELLKKFKVKKNKVKIEAEMRPGHLFIFQIFVMHF